MITEHWSKDTERGKPKNRNMAFPRH